MKLYTRTGDAGMTSLADGRRVSKTSLPLEAYGTVDELNSHIGLLVALLGDDPSGSKEPLERIQLMLFDLGSYLAAVPELTIADGDIKWLEDEIDRLTALAPAMHCFVLPGGTVEASQANIARTVCRRAERRMLEIPASELSEPSGPSESSEDFSRAVRFVNRLSDYLFALARALNALASVADIPWHPRQKK